MYGSHDESVSLWNDELKTQVTLYTYPAQGTLQESFDGALSEMQRTCTEGPVMSTTIGKGQIGGCVRRLDDDTLLLEQVMVMKEGSWLRKARITFFAEATMSAYSPAMSLVSQAFQPCPSQA